VTPVFIDLETRSACDLKAEGSYKYAKHPTTRLLTVAWAVDGEEHVWLPGLTAPPPKAHADLHLPGVTVHVGGTVPSVLARRARRPWVGHNSWTFDRLVWDECTSDDWPVRWVDTYPLALSVGLPGGLDAIGKALWGEGKYEAGAKALKKAYRATGPDDCEPENVPVGQTLLVAKYNLQDVRLTKALYERVTREARTTPHEERVRAAHDTINARGLRIDLGLTRALVKLADESKAHAITRIAELTDGALPDQAAVQSRARVLEWLDAQGLKFTSLRRDVVTRYVDTHRAVADEDASEDDSAEDEGGDATPKVDLSRIVKVLELRMSALRITGGKLETALSATDDDRRLRHWSVYWGAHTGRWAARRIQPHNFPRPKEGVDTWRLLDLYESTGRLDYSAVRATLPLDARGADGKLLYPYLSVDDAASALLRSIIVPDEGDVLAMADLSNIECRVLAWCAGEKWLTDSFWDGGDPYMTMAERIFGPRATWTAFPDPKTGKPLPIKKHPFRQVGKVVVLGAGYQLGGDKFALYAAANGIDLTRVGVTPHECILAFRQMHPAVAGEYHGPHPDHGRPIFRGGLWYDLNRAVVMCVTDCVRTYAGRCSFHMADGNLICTLPSGRRLVYRAAQVQAQFPSWYEGTEGIPAVTYWSPRYGRKHLYGGSITENVVQAIARDVIAHGLVLLEEGGMPVALHVHDELVSSVRGGRPLARTRYGDFMRAVTTRPDWLTDFPLDAEGGLTERYSKTVAPGATEQLWRNGCRK